MALRKPMIKPSRNFISSIHPRFCLEGIPNAVLAVVVASKLVVVLANVDLSATLVAVESYLILGWLKSRLRTAQKVAHSRNLLVELLDWEAYASSVATSSTFS
ncbi:hypothetical protein [uncultured Duncaniella sp.]|uniref:hypothetical protein n=1 Tax=uncultured Duncaniella sp. TaxID=2768039 RepID=UPI0026255A9F|nr:hypothetical protein [uncultured Duncaniella sp.]